MIVLIETKGSISGNLLLFGAGCHGKVVKETAELMGCFDKIDFVDDNTELGNTVGRCIDYRKFLGEYKYAFPCFGNNVLRLKWLNILIKAGFELPVIVHPTAYISPSTKIGDGTIVEAKAVINTDTIVHKGALIGIGALIDHDCKIGACVHINCGAIIKDGSSVKRGKKVDSGLIYQSGPEFDKVMVDKEVSFELGI